MIRSTLSTLLVATTLAACANVEEAADAPMNASDPAAITLGPVEGLDLPPVDLERVQVGDVAPDFTLVSLAGPPVTLSSFRGTSDVILVFYRGHW